MSLDNPFYFKQFIIFHNNSTMKVGTDAILLSVWCDVAGAKNILDVGTGSGIIALLLATRTNATIDAVELDSSSAKEAELNFNNFSNALLRNKLTKASEVILCDNKAKNTGIAIATASIFNEVSVQKSKLEWSSYFLAMPKYQLSIYHDDFNNFVGYTTKKYDLIISNPPFFSVGVLPKSELRSSTRHTSTLSHSQLCKGAASLLSAAGKFCIVLPINSSDDFITTANSFNLYLRKQQIIYPKPNKTPNRINLEFRFKNSKSVISEDIIIRDKNNLYTNEYKHYVGDYMTV